MLISKSEKVVLQYTIQVQSPKINRINTMFQNTNMPKTSRFTKLTRILSGAVMFHRCSQHEGGMQIIERCMFLAQAPLLSPTM